MPLPRPEDSNQSGVDNAVNESRAVDDNPDDVPIPTHRPSRFDSFREARLARWTEWPISLS